MDGNNNTVQYVMFYFSSEIVFYLILRHITFFFFLPHLYALLYFTDTLHAVCSTYECLMTPSLTCCSTWWPRSGSWNCPSCSSQSTGACRTLNCSPNSSRSLAKGSSRLPWQQGPGYSLEESTQVNHGFWLMKTNLKSFMFAKQNSVK